MKKYKILISSTLLLTSTVTVQATTLIEVRLTGAVGGYSAGDYVAFSSISDFLANVNGTVTFKAGDSTYRDLVSAEVAGGSDATHTALGLLNGALYVEGSGNIGSATWVAGNFSQFSYDQVTGRYEVGLTNTAGGYAAGSYVSFSNASDLLNNTNGTVALAGVGLTYLRDSTYAETGNQSSYHTALNPTTGNFYLEGSGFIGDATWLAGNVDTYSFDESAYVVPEPSSVVLSALGGLGLLARRRRR